MIATELIFDDKGSIIGFNSLDPKSIQMIFDSKSGQFIWVQINDKKKLKKILKYNQVIITNK